MLEGAAAWTGAGSVTCFGADPASLGSAGGGSALVASSRATGSAGFGVTGSAGAGVAVAAGFAGVAAGTGAAFGTLGIAAAGAAGAAVRAAAELAGVGLLAEFDGPGMDGTRAAGASANCSAMRKDIKATLIAGSAGGTPGDSAAAGDAGAMASGGGSVTTGAAAETTAGTAGSAGGRSGSALRLAYQARAPIPASATTTPAHNPACDRRGS